MIKTGKLIFVHLQKTGGTHISTILKELFEGQKKNNKHVALKDLAEGVLEERHIIGSIRNPWDWYISLWGYGNAGKGTLQIRLTNLSGENLGKLYSDPNNVENFRIWLTAILDPANSRMVEKKYDKGNIAQHIGLLTYRYMNLFCSSFYRNRIFSGYDEVADFCDKKFLVHSMIKNENLENDLIAALENAGYQLDEPTKELIHSKKENKINASKRNGREHYYDDELYELVKKRERYIIEKYNYS